MSANMMYRLAAYSYFKAAVAVEKKKEEGGGGVGVGATAHLASLYLQSAVTPVGAAEKPLPLALLSHLLSFFSHFFSVLFLFCLSKWQQMKTCVRTRFLFSIIHRGLKKISNTRVSRVSRSKNS